MSRQEFETALSAEGWTQREMDDLRALMSEAIALREVYRMANMELSAALSRWNGGLSAKVDSLGAAFAIPNPTDLDGGSDVTKESLQNMMGYASTVAGLGTSGHLDNILPLVGRV